MHLLRLAGLGAPRREAPARPADRPPGVGESVKLELELDSDPIVAGKEVTGRVNVAEGGSSRSVTLTLSFHEKSRDYEAIPYSSDISVHEGDLLTGHSFDFQFTMPPAAPPSFKTKHGELYWELVVNSDESGPDTHLSRRVEVVAP